ASRVIQQVNSVHTSGVGLDGKGGQVFFDGTDASDISVDSALTGPNGTDHLAAARMSVDPTSSTGYSYASGDSSNALAIASLANGVGQLSSSSTVQPGATYAGPPSTTVSGVDLSQVTPNTTLNITSSGNTVSINGVAATVTE